MKVYRVWVNVEVEDDEAKHAGDEYSDLDLQFASTAQFDDEDEAISFAHMLNDVGEIIRRGLDCSPDEDDDDALERLEPC